MTLLPGVSVRLSEEQVAANLVESLTSHHEVQAEQWQVDLPADRRNS